MDPQTDYEELLADEFLYGTSEEQYARLLQLRSDSTDAHVLKSSNALLLKSLDKTPDSVTLGNLRAVLSAHLSPR